MAKKNLTLTPELEETLDSLFQATPPEAASLNALKKARTALGEVLPTHIYYEQLPSSMLGPIWVAVSDDGVVAVDWDVSEVDFLASIAKKTRANFKYDSSKTENIVKQVSAYLEGRIEALDIPIDNKLLTDFQYQVLMAARDIPRGKISTYGEIAKDIGKPKAARAVGQALRRNPIPIILPCHRVISSNGSLGGYAGEMGSQKKIRLLKLEGVMLT